MLKFISLPDPRVMGTGDRKLESEVNLTDFLNFVVYAISEVQSVKPFL